VVAGRRSRGSLRTEVGELALLGFISDGRASIGLWKGREPYIEAVCLLFTPTGVWLRGGMLGGARPRSVFICGLSSWLVCDAPLGYFLWRSSCSYNPCQCYESI
jgi:hypothetical protein